ncbi:unnamed protein product [Clavelina lepadiformis]|uniref:Tyrosyl-DNA phosphodiesterase 2 n=1 Tax=Clavelina lepadiformis TaxID=159417 RepID=A0ABP0F1L7_CLALP
MDSSIQKFMEISGVKNRETALYYIELADGNVERAINLHYEDDDAVIIVEDEPAMQASSASSSNSPTNGEMTVLEWNIQGLLGDFLKERTVAVVAEIKRLVPDVVMLQEVVPSTLQYIISACQEYKLYSPPDAVHYFSVMLTRKATFQVLAKSVINFPTSMQGRSLVAVKGNCCSRKVTLLTSHLESCKPSIDIRIQQFVNVCGLMKEEEPESTVIFGADTNLRDYEVDKAKRQSEAARQYIVDIWNILGSPKEVEHSWDLTKNDNQIKGGNARLRFERLYMRKESPSSSVHFKPVKMEFIGTSRLSCGLFPSDHWGILVKLKI